MDTQSINKYYSIKASTDTFMSNQAVVYANDVTLYTWTNCKNSGFLIKKSSILFLLNDNYDSKEFYSSKVFRFLLRNFVHYVISFSIFCLCRELFNFLWLIPIQQAIEQKATSGGKKLAAPFNKEHLDKTLFLC